MQSVADAPGSIFHCGDPPALSGMRPLYWQAPPAQKPKLVPDLTSQVVPAPGQAGPPDLHAHTLLWQMPLQMPLEQVTFGGQSLFVVQVIAAQSASESHWTPCGTLHATKPEEELGQSLFLVQLICEQKPPAQLTPEQFEVPSGSVTQQSLTAVQAFPPMTDPPTTLAALACQRGYEQLFCNVIVCLELPQLVEVPHAAAAQTASFASNAKQAHTRPAKASLRRRFTILRALLSSS